MKIILYVTTILIVLFSSEIFSQQFVEKYKIFEAAFEGPSDGNPFKDVKIRATFRHKKEIKQVSGFYDGNGKFKIRFLPDLEGHWTFAVKSNNGDIDGQKGAFECTAPTGKNHGIVRVANTYHFKFDDQTPFYPFGTTCYAWIHQPVNIQEQTLKTLKSAPFNKIRMCVFPKWYDFNKTEPEIYPYQGNPPRDWDYWLFNCEFFRHLEKRISQLNEMGIQCDLILFHPYDGGHWGFDRMSDEQDDFYLRYLIARLAAYQNIWWSLANEWDFMSEKQPEDWDRFFKILKEEDPYNHLCSIHNGVKWYNYANPAVTHLSIQGDPWEAGGVGGFYQKIDRWAEKFKKPIIIDEMKYEGNILYSYGDLTAEEMTERFWYVYTKGAYATHGETYMEKNDILWWAKGGKLHGKSPERIAFLKNIIENAPPGGLEAFPGMEEDGNAVRIGEKYYLFYFGRRQPAERVIFLPDNKEYKLDIIDTWGMTIHPLDGTFRGKCIIPLPGKPYIAVRAIVN